MDQQKTGKFLRKLRKEKKLTQEQLAETLNVSSRTVSRWETGTNMPDLGILVELADLYGVDVREILDGERKSGQMKNELKDTLRQAAEYSRAEKEKLKKRMVEVSVSAALLLLFAAILKMTDGFGGYIPARPIENMTNFAAGAALGILILNALSFAGVLDKAGALKRRLFKR